MADMDLIGLTPSDEAALARMLAAYESGSLNRQQQRGEQNSQRVYEAVPFINAASETIPAYAVMRITTPTTVDGEMIVNVAKPDGTYRWRYLINGPDDVDSSSGARGYGTWAFDIDKVLKDTGTNPTVGQEWGPKSGSWLLWQHRPGFIVDGRYDSTTGVLWAQQVIPQEVLVYNATGSAIGAAASGTATLYGGTAGSEATLGMTVTAYNRTSVSWADAKYGAVGRLNGKEYVVPFQT